MGKPITNLGKMWELRHSIWMSWLFFPLGFTAFISFLVIGVKAKEKKWMIAGFIYLALLVQFFIVDEYFPIDHIVYDLSVMGLLGMWIAAWVHATKARPVYLRRIAAIKHPNSVQEVPSRPVTKYTAKSAGSVPVKKYKNKQKPRGTETRTKTPKIININMAGQEEIAALPSFDNITAKRVIEVRKQVGSFESMAHFIKVMEIKPHIIAKAKPYIIFTDGPPGQGPRKRNAAAKVCSGKGCRLLMHVQLHRFLPLTNAEGPGKRACIWVQGCPIHCKGCGVPWTWNPKLGTATDVKELWDKILKSKEEHDIEGITFLGGEPFEQAEALSKLAERAQKAGLSVMAFSGYYMHELEELDKPGWRELLANTDIFLDGPFEINKPDRVRPWIGSTNQGIHFLTDRYKTLEKELLQVPDRLEIYLKKDGTIEANGMVPSEAWKRLFKGL